MQHDCGPAASGLIQTLENAIAGHFYFTSLLEYIREQQRSMKDVSGLESIEQASCSETEAES